MNNPPSKKRSLSFDDVVKWASDSKGEGTDALKKVLEDTFQLNEVKVKIFLMALAQNKIRSISKMAEHLQLVHERMIDPSVIDRATPKQLIAFHNILAGEINNYTQNNKQGQPPVSLQMLVAGDVSLSKKLGDEGRQRLRDVLSSLLPTSKPNDNGDRPSEDSIS